MRLHCKKVRKVFYLKFSSVDQIKRQLEKMTMMINQALQGNNLNNNGGSEAIDPAVQVRNQDIIIAGGLCAPRLEHVPKTAETINKVEGKSTQLPSMNIARGKSASYVYNGDVIITGGYDGKGGTDSIEMLKMNQHPLRWTMFDGKLPVKLCDHAVIVYQDKLYVIGGNNWSVNKVSDRIYQLTLTPLYTFKLLANIPQPRCYHISVLVNGHVYVIGGTTTRQAKDATDSVVVYDFIKDKIKSCPSLLKPVLAMATVTWGNMIVVLGGADMNDNTLNDVTMYDTETGQSEILPSLRHKRSGHCAVIMHDVIVVFGGWNKEERYLNSVETFTMGSTEWRELPGMKEKRRFACAVVKPHQ